jgi:K+-sensing histidine kinase KdpD
MLAAFKARHQRVVASVANDGPLLASQSAWVLMAIPYLVTLVMTAFATLLAIVFDQNVTIPNLSLIFVVPVIISAVGFGLGPSIFSSILGALAYNFFLTEPRYTLRVDDPAAVWAIGLLFVVGCIASAVASTARKNADEAALRERQAGLLRGYGHDVSAAHEPSEIAAVTAKALTDLFEVQAVVIRVSNGDADLVATTGAIELQEAEFEAARLSLTTCAVVRAGVFPADASRFDLWPVPVRAAPHIVVGLAFDPDARPSKPDTLVEIVAGFMALALDREYLGDRPGEPDTPDRFA